MAKRIAVVDNEKLKSMQQKEEIKSICPVNRSGTDCIEILDDNKLYINEDSCIGCGICIKKAPEAISIVNLPEELDSEPIHRYGKNGFALYSLPTPLFGKVVGILGRNGIGKSTAVKVLAGLLKPNFGKEKEASYDDLIQRFKGTEAQSFFEKLKKDEIVVSYKPQQVELIPKNFSGTVKELLSKVDEKEKLEEMAQILDLNKFMDHDIKKISGGELQRVAIAACVLKKANVYFFDEPTSYLDVKQRLKVSKFIREMADENTAVMVIEHDLIVLDYMTDLIHLMYGKPGTYGVVSQPKATRTGINIYLSGYLKEENMRFRDYEIKFESHAPIDSKKIKELTKWEEFEETFGSFKLKANSGEIYEHDIVGILGENGIGKTSFVKILAGVEKDHELEGLKVSYKPQYIEAEDEIVLNFLSKAVERYNAQLIIPFELKDLLYRNLKELSGGELQRVYIAKALSEDSQLILMDEPSAYLDVEQRLKLGKIIKDLLQNTGRSALIVDHDLLFIDTISERIVVFHGEPAVHGEVNGPFFMEEGMNDFLQKIELTFRRDQESKRPRINKQGSQKDVEQKKSGKLYYG
jgi:ATP-binding cassette subfamily E protein 1